MQEVVTKLPKTKTAQKLKEEKTSKNGSALNHEAANGNGNGSAGSVASTLRNLNKTYASARTKKEKDNARKALTLATFNATYESHQKRRS